MKIRRMVPHALLTVSVLLALVAAVPAPAATKVAVYGIHMDPSSQDARDFSDASYGGGIHAVFAAPFLAQLFGASVGIEGVNFKSETHEFRDPDTGLRVEQQTSQDMFRFYLGPEFGPHGFGFLRPHVAVHLSGAYYSISTDVVVPDDYNREQEIRQVLREKHEGSFGYDITAGTDLNFGRFLVEGGTRLVKSFNVPQQLGADAVKIHPAYVQIYLGVGLNLRKSDLN